MTLYRKEFGQKGEDLAVQYLQSNGYKVLERNFNSRIGEIDIVAKEGECLVFVEVKAKTGIGWGSPEEMVNKKKQRKIIRTAEYYIYKEELGEIPWRIDVVAVEKDLEGDIKRINLIKNAVER